MATRKDQLHSYQFMLQRVISAVVMRETDPAQAPLRRGSGAAFIGVMIAVIVAAVFGIIGIFTKIGGDSWKQDNTVIIEKETGAVYVYRNERLTPTLNFASALLLSGQTPPAPVSVSRKSLATIPRGVVRGIPNAPTALPGSDKVAAAPWSLCSVPAHDTSGNPISKTELAVGRAPTGGRTLGGSGLLVKDSDNGDVFLIWHSTRYKITKPETVDVSLFGQATPVTVGMAWLNGLPAGADIGPIDVPKRGEASSALSGQHVGDVVFERTGAGDRQYYLVYDDGIAAISRLQETILAGEYDLRVTGVSASEVNGAPKSSQLQPPAQEIRPPDAAPKLVSVHSGAACALYKGSKHPPEVRVGAGFPAIGGVTTSSKTSGGTALADLVAVNPGHVAVVRTMASSSATRGAYSLVTDTGTRYGVPNADVLKTLGYDPSSAVDMPAGLVARIPAGPELTPAAAKKAVEVGG